MNKTSYCWLWTGCFHSAGYGQFQIKQAVGRHGTAHRFSWELYNGKIEEGKCVLHKCDVRACVNPGHLFLGTRGDNARDRHAKGRDTKGESSPLSILSENLVKQMRELYANGASCDKIAKQFNIKYITAYQAIKRINWKHI